MSPRDRIVDRFRERYGQPVTAAALAVERQAIGGTFGASGYTTVAQVDVLARRLDLRPGARLLDIGAGRGWPGLYLAAQTGCEVVLADVPEPGLRAALASAQGQGLLPRSSVIKASGTHLPFRARSFDAVVHTDTL